MGEFVNSKTARFDRSYTSCGVTEVHHLPPNASQTVFAIANHLYNKGNPRPGAFVVWSDVVNEGERRGENLATALMKVGVGVIQDTPKAANPRTGNIIRVWVLTVDHDKFRKWYQDELANRITE